MLCSTLLYSTQLSLSSDCCVKYLYSHLNRNLFTLSQCNYSIHNSDHVCPTGVTTAYERGLCGRHHQDASHQGAALGSLIYAVTCQAQPHHLPPLTITTHLILKQPQATHVYIVCCLSILLLNRQTKRRYTMHFCYRRWTSCSQRTLQKSTEEHC